MVPLVYRINHLQGEMYFLNFFLKKPQSLKICCVVRQLSPGIEYDLPADIFLASCILFL
jgi:hypothetical protein